MSKTHPDKLRKYLKLVREIKKNTASLSIINTETLNNLVSTDKSYLTFIANG